ncbi:MAG: chalcone isomerase family protein [Gammaproteobacteria bacterium]|nr:chalcone isomerase family protein [Gammaproteobacteria bacterium]
MTYQRNVIAILCLALGLLTTTSGRASTGFPERIQLENHELQRIGSGTARYAGIITVYQAVLYAPASTARGNILDTDVPKRLEIVYSRSIEKAHLIEAAEHALERQQTPEILDRWRSTIDELHAAYQDVSAGDRFALVLLPEKGLSLELNGQGLLRIDKPDFARIYFGIWLGETPLSASLRDDLLPTDCCQQ